MKVVKLVKYISVCLLIGALAIISASCSSNKRAAERSDNSEGSASKPKEMVMNRNTKKDVELVKNTPEDDKKEAMKNSIVADLQAKSGSKVSGQVKIQARKGSGLVIRISATGLKPGSIHGFHIHETGDCSADDGSSAGGHFSPHDMPHGSPASEKRHAGDLGNMQADKDGKINRAILVGNLSLDPGDEASILNRAVILHADPDDYKSQPSGNAGKRIACAVIK